MELIGRDSDLAEIGQRLGNRRLVTLTGPGGIGKTTLALKAAAEFGDGYELGAVVADLTRVDEPEGVAEAIADQLGFPDFSSLLNSPQDRSLLMVLDKCEHVLDAAAEAATRLLNARDAPRILATSRSPLDLPGESVITLGPLAVPVGEVADAAHSLQLFVARSRDNGVEIPQADLGAAADVCRRLDGVPLALEIAAARLRSLTVTELLEELEARPHALARPRFRGKPTHRSVADLVGWSTDLLPDESARFFNRLGVFSGPFTAAMAQALAAGEPDDRPATVDLLDDLISASLVTADTGGQVTRYRLLHPIRAVAVDRLQQSGEAQACQSRWVDHVVELAVEVILRNSAGWDAKLLDDLLALYGNISAALRWTVANEHEERADRSLILLSVLWGVIHQSHTEEVLTIGEAVLRRWPDPDLNGWSDAAATVATCRNLLGDPEGAIELANRALPNVGQSHFGSASLRRVLAQAHRSLGHREESRHLFRLGAEAAEELNSAGLAMELWVDHAVLLAELGDPDAGLAVIERVLAEADERGAAINYAWAMVGRGVIELSRDAETALPALEAALAEAQRIGYPAGVSTSLRALAMAHFDLGRNDEAASAVDRLLDQLLIRGGLNDLRMALEIGARVAERFGDPSWDDLAITARDLPITTVSTAVASEVFERAASTGRALPHRLAYVECKRVMADVVAGGPVGAEPAAQAGCEAGRGAVAESTTDDDRTETSVCSLVREGDVWLVTFAGSATRFRASKGFADLAQLLGRPGREVAAIDLTGGVANQSSDELLDETARRQYENRIRELQAELDEADAAHDLGTSERLGAELDALVEQLASAVGLGGRSRRVTDGAERARSAVTQRLRGTIKRIAAEQPELGAHLTASISTGTLCCYRPPSPTEWIIEP